MVTISKRDKANAARYKPIADKLLPVIKKHLPQSDTENERITPDQMDLVFFDDRPKTYAWNFAMHVAISYFEQQQQEQNLAYFEKLAAALKQLEQALNNVPPHIGYLLELFLSPERDLRFLDCMHSLGESFPARNPSELERALLREKTNADGTMNADVIGGHLMGRQRLSERERALVVDKLTGKDGLDQLIYYVSLASHRLAAKDLRGWGKSNFNSRHNALAIVTIQGCLGVWENECLRVEPTKWVDSARSGKRPLDHVVAPKAIHHDALSPFGRFAQEVFEVLDIRDRSGNDIANPSTALRALVEYKEKVSSENSAITPAGEYVRVWQTDSDIT